MHFPYKILPNVDVMKQNNPVFHVQLAYHCILSAMPRTTMTSPSTPNDIRCKTYPLCVNPGILLWNCEKIHILRVWFGIFLWNMSWLHSHSPGEIKYSYHPGTYHFANIQCVLRQECFMPRLECMTHCWYSQTPGRTECLILYKSVISHALWTKIWWIGIR